MHRRNWSVPMFVSLCALLLAAPAFAEEPATPSEAEAAKAAVRMVVAPESDAAIKAIDAQIAKAAVKKADAAWRTKLPMPTAVKFSADRQYLAHLMTNKGEIVITFMPAVAPLHVTNFIYLARLGYYDGLTFHRVIPGFMAQGGDPIGNGTGGPGYGFNGEFSESVRHTRPGMLSMANAGPGTDGSQFFLTFVPTPWLDGKHTLFGEVVSGMDALKAIEAVGTKPAGATKEKVVMSKVTIEVR
jgi:peptidyl-prolyl cis-trans isomerase B (cyclophilin B)